MKFDAQIEKNCRVSKGIRKPKLYYCKKLSNHKPMANTVRNTRRITLCWMRGKIKEHLFIKVIVYLPFWSNCWIPRHSVPPLFSLVGVLWRTKHNTIDAILIQWHANKWQGILPLSRPSLYNFRKEFSTKQDIAPKVPVLRRNKATNSSSSTDPFSAAIKPLY